MRLPSCRTLELERTDGVLKVWLARPEVRNAVSLQMIDELERLLDALDADGAAAGGRAVRVVVLRGRGGNFCAGADVVDMAVALNADLVAGGADPLRALNRRFGGVLARLERCPKPVVALLEGAVMGGGLGLACASDVTLARADAHFRLPEVTLGLPPAQIAPFLVRRLGISQARRLALAPQHFDGAEAWRIGLVHDVCADETALEAAAHRVVDAMLRGAPGALAATKRLLRRAAEIDLAPLLDEGAALFAACARGPEGTEGMSAFIEKRPARWVPRPAPTGAAQSRSASAEPASDAEEGSPDGGGTPSESP